MGFYIFSIRFSIYNTSGATPNNTIKKNSVDIPPISDTYFNNNFVAWRFSFKLAYLAE